jgi:hypothetical protein
MMCARVQSITVLTVEVCLCLCVFLQARHDKLGGPRPTLLVVSLHADDTNRAPTFDIDLNDLFNPDGAFCMLIGCFPAHSIPHSIQTICKPLNAQQ